jgi:peptidoglycan/xylan/chitin deacetylase (PgdA/CDA1 family)
MIISRALSWFQRRLHESNQQRLQAGGPALKGLLFHGLYDDTFSPCPEGVDTSLICSLSSLERCLKETREQGFRFIHADEIPSALKSRERVALLTFDDGYANNRLMLPILNRLQVPALLFVTTDSMIRRQSYWWDVLARESLKTSLSVDQLSQKRRSIKTLKPLDIEQYLKGQFGQNCYHPQGDHDRPMTPEELKLLARDPLIAIGNHTHHHALLSQLNSNEIENELSECQNYLREIIDYCPQTLAYPNGRWSADVARIARELGIQLAFTAERSISSLPASADQWMSLPRLQP